MGRKFIVFIVVVLLVVSLVGCSKSDEKETPTSTSSSSTSSTSTSSTSVPSTSAPASSSNDNDDYSDVKPFVGEELEVVAVRYLELINNYDAKTFIAFLGGVKGSTYLQFDDLSKSINMSVVEFGRMHAMSEKDKYESEVGKDWIKRYSIVDLDYHADLVHVYLEFSGSSYTTLIAFKLEDEAWIMY